MKFFNDLIGFEDGSLISRNHSVQIVGAGEENYHGFVIQLHAFEVCNILQFLYLFMVVANNFNIIFLGIEHLFEVVCDPHFIAPVQVLLHTGGSFVIASAS